MVPMPSKAGAQRAPSSAPSANAKPITDSVSTGPPSKITAGGDVYGSQGSSTLGT
jgi:hypothetical protein